MLIARKFYLSRERMLAFLDDLKGASEPAQSLYLPAGLPSQQITALVSKIEPADVVSQMTNLAVSSPTGAVIFWSQTYRYLITPPLPIEEERSDDSFVVEPLSSLLSRDLQIGLILVRLGAYAVGLCRGENLFASKVGTGNIHSRHHQGGSSQARFQRHREKQIESFLTRVCGHIEEIFRPEEKLIDYLVYGGAQTTILLLKKRCSFLRQFEDCKLPPLLDIPEPRQLVLEKSVGRIWSSAVTEWRDDTSPRLDRLWHIYEKRNSDTT